MKAKPNRDHLVYEYTTGAILCEHCGASYQVKLPVGLGRFANIIEGFMLIHEHCEPRTNEERK